MTSSIAIEGLSKRYRLGDQAGRHTRVTDAALQAARKLLRAPVGGRRREERSVLALRDVSLDVSRGQTLGVIGANGSGKSTLLKVLARITEPTAGRVTIRGRVGALIEVGTGFHPELTGRENVFLNGAILGMSRAEIRRKFDQIVEFAGTEQFLDTPVKRYSSGMKVRLAFSVAAHLEPEVLLVDEVLAVGDADFQRRCLGRMSEIGRSGRTILFVSHNLSAVESLCDRAIWLESGSIRAEGPASSVVSDYLADRVRVAEPVWRPPAREDPDARCHSIRLLGADERPRATFVSSEPVFVEFDVEVLRRDPSLKVGFDVATQEGVIAFRSFHDDLTGLAGTLETGRWRIRCAIPPHLCNTGLYSIHARIVILSARWIVQADDVLQFEIKNSGGVGGHYGQPRPGVVRPAAEWTWEPAALDGQQTTRDALVR